MMEPLAVALRASGEVKAIGVGTIDEGLALYADDLLLFLRHPRESLEAALLIVNKFTTFLGLRVNWNKTSILPLDAGAKEIAEITYYCGGSPGSHTWVSRSRWM